MNEQNNRQSWLIGVIVALVLLCSCLIVCSAVAMPLTYNWFRMQVFF